MDRDGYIGRLAITLGVVVSASIVSLAVFYAVGGPFGAINDPGNALVGILSALLAWTLRPRGMEGSFGGAALRSSSDADQGRDRSPTKMNASPRHSGRGGLIHGPRSISAGPMS